MALDSGLFPTSTPESQGIDTRGILNMLDAAEKDGRAFHSMLILRHGVLVAEHYWHPYDARTRHVMYSVSKSFTSTAVGLCVSDGLLTVEDGVLSFFPEHAPQNPCENLKKMKVKHLLTMSTGQKEEPFPKNPKDSWIASFLGAPVEREPGTVFNYNSLATFMLSAIVQKLTGRTVHDILEERVFSKIGIVGSVFDKNPEGINCGGWGLHITPRDMLRFGYLYLSEGKWDGEQVVPAEWVREATRRHTCRVDEKSDKNWVAGYGYQFWRCAFEDAYRADGAFGQFIVAIPSKDMVCVFTSALAGDLAAPLNFIEECLLPCVHDEALPDNRALNDEMEARFEALNRPPVSYGPYTLKRNKLGLKSIAFDFSAGAVITMRTRKGESGVPCSLGPAFAVSRCACFEYFDKLAVRGGWADGAFHFTMHSHGGHDYVDFAATFEGKNLKLHMKSETLNWESTDAVITGVVE